MYQPSKATDFGAYLLTAEWNDLTADWTHASTGVTWTAGGAKGALVSTSSLAQADNIWKTFDLTSAVRGFVSAPTSNRGVLISMDDRSGGGTRFFSSDHADVGKRPKLTVTYSGGTPTALRPVLSPSTDTMFINPVSVTMKSADTSVIRYTTDGSDPTESSPSYSAPFNAGTTTLVKARAYKSGSNPSPIVALTYTKINGIDYKYYEGAWTMLPDFTALTAKDSGVSADVNVRVRKRDTNFGLVFHGTITVQAAGTYTFFLNTSDGSRLFVGTTRVVNNDGVHPSTEKYGTIALATGTFPFRVEFFAGTNTPVLNASYSGPSILKTIIPPTVLGRGGSTGVGRSGYRAGRSAAGSMAVKHTQTFRIDGSRLYRSESGGHLRRLGAGVLLTVPDGGSAGVLSVGR